jgi:hypothetical protein
LLLGDKRLGLDLLDELDGHFCQRLATHLAEENRSVCCHKRTFCSFSFGIAML